MKSVSFKIGNNPIQSSTPSTFSTPSTPSTSSDYHNINLPVASPSFTKNMKSDSYIHKNCAYKHVENIFYFIH